MPRAIRDQGFYVYVNIRALVGLIAVGLVGLLPLQTVGEEDPTLAPPPPEPAQAAGVVSPTLDHIDRWISELSDDTYAVRQLAAARLMKAGVPAREALLAAAEGPDPESRATARRLVALIDRSEFHRRLEAFAADTEGRHSLTLPGWESYRRSVGDDPSARALFVEMQRQEAPLLAAVFDDGKPSPDQLWEERLIRLVQWPATVGDRSATPPLGSCAAMLFLATAPEVNVSDRGAVWIENLIQRPPIREALGAADAQDTIRRLVSGWILNCPNDNEHILARRLNLASTIDLREALPLALAVAGGDPKYASVAPSTQGQAILLVGQFGGREHVRHLEPLLEDATVCIPLQAQVPGQPVRNVQVRDAALVVMLHLTGQRPADYGYVHARLQPQRTFQLQTLFRDTDEQRAAAVAKWRTWRAAQKRVNLEADVPRGKEQEKKSLREQQRNVEVDVPGFEKLTPAND